MEETTQGSNQQDASGHQLERALYLISETASSSQSLDELCLAIHKIIGGLIPAANFYIATYDETTNTVDFPYYVDEYSQPPGKRICKKGLTEYVIRTGQPQLVSPQRYAELLREQEAEKFGTTAIDWMGVPLKNASNKVIGVLAVQTYQEGVRYTEQHKNMLNFVSNQVAMVMERKRAEEELRASEEKYRAIVEHSHDAIYIYSERRSIYANDNLYRLLEIPPKTQGKLQIMAYVHREDREELSRYLAQPAADGRPFIAAEVRLLCGPDIKFAEVHLNKIVYGGEPAFIWTIRDISERKAAEKLHKALYAISETANSAVSLEKLYSSVHGIIGELIYAENFFIALYDEVNDVVSFPYHVDNRVMKPLARHNGQGLTDYVIRTGQAVMVSSDEYLDLVAAGKVRQRSVTYSNWLGVPLKTSDHKVFGVLGVKTYKGCPPYTEKEKEILSFVSHQVAMAIRRKQDETQLQYFSFRDSLSGLYNRRYFEEEMRRLDKRRGGSVGIIILDVDGLKLVNDMFGHDSGDTLLSKVGRLLAGCFREQDIVARIGGDEYAVLLSDADEMVVQMACDRVQDRISRENPENNPPLSLSIGYAVSDDPDVSMLELFKRADNNMYREKLQRSQMTRSAIVQTMMKLLEERDFITEGHADRMQELVIRLGEKCGLNSERLSDLRLLAQFHDIGKVGILSSILAKPGRLTEEERLEVRRHAEIGHRIAQSAPELHSISDLVLKHHEWWNGSGYPMGLAGEDIPLESRILSIADAYDAMTSDRPYRKAMSHAQAVAELKKYAGIQFDPVLVEKFLEQ